MVRICANLCANMVRIWCECVRICANMCEYYEYEENSGCRTVGHCRTLSESLSDSLSDCRTIGGLSDYCRTLSDTVETLSDKIGKIDIDKRANIN